MTDQIRDRIAAALYERERPPRDPHWVDAYPVDREVFEAMADAVVAALGDATAWTPPPPGDRREQLPDHLLTLIDIPPYLSTACEAAQLLEREMVKRTQQRIELGDHGDRLHSRCRINNKFTGALCHCPCHPEPGAA